MVEKPDDVICEGDVCRKVTPEEAAARNAGADAPTSQPRVFDLLGEGGLLGKDGAVVPLSSVTGPNKVLALYFSAHWCPPCRGFTPHLASIYSRFKASHPRAADWEVIFVSSDRDDESFRDYFGDMPWLALPYGQREAKAELSKLFKVRGIPTLVIVDGETGETITVNGRDAVGDDEECQNFPWRPKTFEQIMEGATLVEPKAEADAAPVPALERLRGKVTLLYFSASWCPPCRAFTPKLVDTVAALRAAGRAVEAVFVSGDRQEEAMREYHGHMTWPALPFADRKRNSELNMLYEVEGIPTLVVLDESFQVITEEGVGAIASDPKGERFPWRPRPLDQLSPLTASRINNGPVLLYLVADAADDAAAAATAEAAVGAIAAAAKAAPNAPGADWSFLWARAEDDLAGRVKKFAGGVKMVEGRGAVILDAPNSQATWDLGALGVELTAAGLAGVVADFKTGKLGKGRPLGAGEEEEEEEE